MLAAMSGTLYSDRHEPVDPFSGEPMSARDDRRIAAARQRLVDLLAEDEVILPGGLIERMTRCGKPNCRCNGDPPQLHGPYAQWGYSRGRERITRRLSAEQTERYRPAIERGRKFTELLVELDELELRRVEHGEGWGT
jgi:predicted DNA-binding protein (UPF0251 family)